VRVPLAERKTAESSLDGGEYNLSMSYKFEIISTKYETNPNDKITNEENIKSQYHLPLRNSLIGCHYQTLWFCYWGLSHLNIRFWYLFRISYFEFRIFKGIIASSPLPGPPIEMEDIEQT
jgi:hypothetical protein